MFDHFEHTHRTSGVEDDSVLTSTKSPIKITPASSVSTALLIPFHSFLLFSSLNFSFLPLTLFSYLPFTSHFWLLFIFPLLLYTSPLFLPLTSALSLSLFLPDTYSLSLFFHPLYFITHPLHINYFYLSPYLSYSTHTHSFFFLSLSFSI